MSILSGEITIGLETEVKMSDVKKLDRGKCSFSQILIELEGMLSSNKWGIGDVGQVSMSELTKKSGHANSTYHY